MTYTPMDTEARKRSYDVCIKFYDQAEYKDTILSNTPLSEDDKKLITDLLAVCPNEVTEQYYGGELDFGDNEYEYYIIMSFIPEDIVGVRIFWMIYFILSFQDLEKCFLEFVDKLPKKIYDNLRSPKFKHSNYVRGCLQYDLDYHLSSKKD